MHRTLIRFARCNGLCHGATAASLLGGCGVVCCMMAGPIGWTAAIFSTAAANGAAIGAATGLAGGAVASGVGAGVGALAGAATVAGTGAGVTSLGVAAGTSVAGSGLLAAHLPKKCAFCALHLY